jgi:hypothetical protein
MSTSRVYRDADGHDRAIEALGRTGPTVPTASG